METITIPITDIMPKPPLRAVLRVRVTGTRLYWPRLKAGLWLLRIAAVIASAVGRLEVEIKA